MTIESLPTSSQESIDLNSSDEVLMHYISQRKNGDPLPSNVIENEDPFTIQPWDADVHNWYLCNIQDSEDAKGGKARTVEGGYWKQKGNDEKIPLNSQLCGRKVNWQFFSGNEPLGNRTAWMIIVYHIKDQEIQDDKQDFNSLCRIYSGNNDEPCLEVGHNSIDDADIEARLLNINDVEENNSLSESAIESQVTDKMPPTERFSEDWAVQGYDTSNDDYITMKDFVDDLSTPSSFENSSRYSEVNPEDPENLLLFLGSEGNISTEQGSFLQDSPVDNSEVPDDCFNPDAVLLYLRGEGNISTEQGSSLQVSPVDNSRTGQLVNEPSLSVPARSSSVDESVPSQSIRNGSNPSPGMPIVNPYRVQRPTSSLSMCIPSSSSSSSNNPSWGFRSMFGEGSSRQKRLASRSSDSSGSGSSRHSGSGRSLSGSATSTEAGKGSGGGSKIKRLGKKYCCLRPF